ncbi:hypothetical protein KDU71_07560 [Carboxylicivirga sediminis]|uniref:Uncharacterized protein n=1 Tax=Carboxylicivirga sediminis TaxID=2006564 RepID=A0A941F265_9BACT|nr:hypothetical protein [Carboxylicivirga sediminis]MBR8535413.1 hypothetical protein [Carboxylicivirga sediminis]
MDNLKIAVFTRTLDEFKDMRFYPKEMFVRIADVRSICGVVFSGVIETAGWWRSSVLGPEQGYEALKERQPELFKS